MAPFDLAAISQQLAEDVSRLVPDSDGYTVEDYFSLGGNYLVEFVDGRLQVLPMPDSLHQAIVFVLRTIFEQWLVGDPNARAAIPEYWIVDPVDRSISVYTLSDGTYQQIETREFAQSRVLGGV